MTTQDVSAYREPGPFDVILDRAANWYDVQVIYPDDAFAQRVHEFLVTMRIAEARCTLPMRFTLGDPDGQPLPRRHVL